MKVIVPTKFSYERVNFWKVDYGMQSSYEQVEGELNFEVEIFPKKNLLKIVVLKRNDIIPYEWVNKEQTKAVEIRTYLNAYIEIHDLSLQDLEKTKIKLKMFDEFDNEVITSLNNEVVKVNDVYTFKELTEYPIFNEFLENLKKG